MVSDVTLVTPGAGELIGDAPGRRVELLCDRDPVHATVSRFGPGMEGADLHVHLEHADLFFVLEGELTVRLGAEDRQVPVPAGALAWVPPGIVHGFRNASERDMRYLNLHAPGSGFATYLRGLRDGVKVVYDQHDPPAGGGPAIDGAVVTAGTATGVLADLPAVRVAREDGPSGPRRESGLCAYYALEDDLELTAGGEHRVAPAGSWVHLAPGVAHEVDGAVLRVVAPGVSRP